MNLLRNSLLVLGLVTILIINSFAQNVIYRSPVPNSHYNMEQSNIIIGYNSHFDKSSIKLKVYGSETGFHSGKISFAHHDKRLIFKPIVPFKLGETVTVSGYKQNESFIFYIRNISTGNDDARISNRLSIETNSTKTLLPNYSGIYSMTDSLPDFSIYKYGETASGKIFIANFSNSSTSTTFLMILNDLGTPVFYRPLVYRAFDFKKQNNLYLYYDENYHFYLGMDSNYVVVDSFHCGNGYSTDFHECILETDNSAWVLNYDVQFVDMSLIVPGGFNNAIVTGTVLQKIDSAKNVVFQWRSWDHIPITDATHENLLATSIDYMHTNSIEKDIDGNIIISSRHLDELTKINTETGEIIWRFGGKHNDFNVTNDTIGFSHQHSARVLTNSNILLFDNGNYHSPSFSRVVEYKINEQEKTAQVVWQYQNSPNIFSYAMGSAQRLQNGNTLIGWGTAAQTLSEVSPNGTLLYRLALPAGQFSYRAFRYDLVNTITNSSIENSKIEKYNLSQNYPNPFNPTTNINYSIPKNDYVRLTVYNLLGQEIFILVNKYQQAGNYSISFDAKSLPSGIYFYKFESGNYSEVKKMSLIK